MGCFPSSIRAKESGLDKLADTNSASSGKSTRSTVAQPSSSHREEAGVQDRAWPLVDEVSGSPRATYEEHLWLTWHETECADPANCTHSFDAVYNDSPTGYMAPLPSASGSGYTLRGSDGTSPGLTYSSPLASGFDEGANSLTFRRHNYTGQGIGRTRVTMLRRTWSESGYPGTPMPSRTPPHSA